MQLSPISSTRHVNSIIYFLLSQISLALSLPVEQDAAAQHKQTRAAHLTTHLSRRAASISSSTISAIGGGVFGLIFLALVIGLGSASIAILGSPEWKEFRGQKDPEGSGKDVEKQKSPGVQGEGIATTNSQPTRSSSTASTASTAQQTVVSEEKTEVQQPRRSRLTLKSLLPPMDFNTTWLHSHSNRG